MKTQVATSRNLSIFTKMSKKEALLGRANKTEIQAPETQSKVQRKQYRCKKKYANNDERGLWFYERE